MNSHKPAVIFDIDGTLADISHRRHLVVNERADWKAFKAAAQMDTPVPAIASVLRAMAFGSFNHLILCSGRGEDEKAATEGWLRAHSLPFHGIYMRAEGDYRAGDIVKEELLDRILADGYDPLLVFDDRNRDVAMWRRRGYVCAQVAPGDF